MFPVLLKLCLAALKFIGELSGPVSVAADALNNTDRKNKCAEKLNVNEFRLESSPVLIYDTRGRAMPV